MNIYFSAVKVGYCYGDMFANKNVEKILCGLCLFYLFMSCFGVVFCAVLIVRGLGTSLIPFGVSLADKRHLSCTSINLKTRLNNILGEKITYDMV